MWHLQLSPKALEGVFRTLREQVADTPSWQDIQAARIVIERFIFPHAHVEKAALYPDVQSVIVIPPTGPQR